MSEEWRDIKGYEGLYQVSNLGRIKSLKYKGGKQERILDGSINNNGYRVVTFRKDNKRRDYLVHRLVAEVFIPNPNNKPFIDHIDTDRTNNRIDNLRWVTQKENCNNVITKKKYVDSSKQSYILGKSPKMIGAKGKDNPKSKKAIQLTLNGEPIKIWDSIREVDRHGFSSTCVVKCCKGYRRTHKGFKWMYLSEYEMNFNV